MKRESTIWTKLVSRMRYRQGVLAFDEALQRAIAKEPDSRTLLLESLVGGFAHKDVIDIGCWTGGLLRDVADLGARHVVGIDIPGPWLAIAQESSPHSKILSMPTLTSMPQELHDSFDIALFLETLEHLPPRTELNVLRSIRTVVRPGGMLILATPAAGTSRLADPAWYLTGHRHYSLHNLKQLLQASGWSIEKVGYSGDFSSWLGIMRHYSAKHLLGRRESHPYRPAALTELRRNHGILPQSVWEVARRSDTAPRQDCVELTRDRSPVSIAVAKLEWAANVVKRAHNWHVIGVATVLSWFGRQDGIFTVECRSGIRLKAPLDDAARTPLLEVATQDLYHLERADFDSDVTTVVDIGAHVGSFTCVVADLLPEATIICVEPSSSSVHWLRHNIHINGLDTRATIVKAAIAGYDGETSFWERGDTSSLSTTQSTPSATSTTVKAVSFKRIFAGAHLHKNDPGGRCVVKIDCEGAEYDAILRSTAHEWSSVDYLYLEYHPHSRHNFRDLIAKIQHFGLELVWDEPDQHTPSLGIAHFRRPRHKDSALATSSTQVL